MERTEKRQGIRYGLVFAGLAAALLALILLNICVGSVSVPLKEILRVLGSSVRDDTDMLVGILWKIRLPRMVSVAFLGGALALAGFLLQTFFSNPIAGPYILGISSGAKLVVSIVMILVIGAGHSVGSAGLIGAAFVGAMLSMGFVLVISQKVPNASALVICGVMIG